MEDPAATRTDAVAIPLPAEAATTAETPDPDTTHQATAPARSAPPADELRDRLRLALAAAGADPFACPESMTSRAPTATMVCATYDGEIDEFRQGWDRWMDRNADALTAVPDEEWSASSSAASRRYRLTKATLEVRVSRGGASVTVRPASP